MFFEKVSLVTGGFDPIHSGHIRYFERAKDLSNYLVVGLNGDPWLKRKKGQYFQSWTERADIIRHLNMVDAVYLGMTLMILPVVRLRSVLRYLKQLSFVMVETVQKVTHQSLISLEIMIE